MKNIHKPYALVLTALALFGYVAIAPAQLNTESKIKNTKHNLSSSNSISGAIKATSEDQICVFCHTPHAANATAPTPLWNRKIAGASNTSTTYAATYQPYQSDSLDAAGTTIDPVTGVKTLPPPGGASKLCLSCHDGTIALGTVGVLDGKANPATVAGLTGTMPTGTGATTGFTRNLGVDLRNDHPISFTFDSTLATADGEFRSPPYATAGSTVVGKRSQGVKPMLPLDHEGKVQCTSCHDPHLTASKFLRLNRLQKVAPAGGEFIAANDQICLGCHNKLGTTWSNSAHANSTVADEAYADLAADRREFARGTKVWEAACLNCHDTHTAQGTRRLLREGVNSTVTGTDAGAYQSGSSASNPATVSSIENTCYQCHQGTATKAIATATGTVPDIKTDFGRSRHMPIETAHQGGGTATSEKHNITNADFIESVSLLGSGNHGNRHVECTDCHNPHRVIRNSKFYGTNADGNKDKRTHDVGGAEGNVASGVLRGTWGVEPTYGAMTTWPQLPSSYTVKKGDPGSSTDTAKSQPYLTREYQLCFKCHSDYSGTSGGNMPTMGGFTGGTPSSTNSMTRYTNVAAEFAVNATDTPESGRDQGEQGNAGTACSGGDCDPTGTSPQGGGATGNNHRSWHPVIWPTGRDAKERTRNSSGTFANIRNPYITNLGTQTMYCSDCHGEYASWTQGTTQGAAGNGPNTGKTQGPHGSDRDFLLKGYWDTSITPSNTRDGNTGNGICGRCHHPSADSGFDGADTEASHTFSAKSSRYCMACHIAVPHGWKNKAFLVNLECVGPEGGQAAGCTAVGGNSSTQTIAPYYNQALLRINTWQASGNWTETSCGAPSYNGKDWMSSACGF